MEQMLKKRVQSCPSFEWSFRVWVSEQIKPSLKIHSLVLVSNHGQVECLMYHNSRLKHVLEGLGAFRGRRMSVSRDCLFTLRGLQVGCAWRRGLLLLLTGRVLGMGITQLESFRMHVCINTMIFKQELAWWHMHTELHSGMHGDYSKVWLTSISMLPSSLSWVAVSCVTMVLLTSIWTIWLPRLSTPGLKRG